ncbi:hypothetical protein ACOSQ3_031816 [Xanthoceras sorbifolium]
MSSSSTHRSRKDRGTEASASGLFSQVDNLDHPGEVELIPSSYGQLLTLYLLFRRNGLPLPSDNVIKHYFALKQCPLTKGSSEYSLHEGMYHLVVWADEHKSLLQGNPSLNTGDYKQLVQRGVYGPSIMAGSAVYPSSGRGLGAVAQEYLKRASMLYKEFLTRGLSQRIEEEEGPDLHHTLIRHAILIEHDGRPFLGSRNASLARGGPSIGCAPAALVILRAYGLIGESLSVLEQVGKGSTLSVYIDPVS